MNRTRLEEPSFLRMRNLLRFNPYVGEPDPILSEETEDFIDVIFNTTCMQLTHQYLIEWGKPLPLPLKTKQLPVLILSTSGCRACTNQRGGMAVRLLSYVVWKVQSRGTE